MAEPIKCPFCNTTHPLPEVYTLGVKYFCGCGARWCLTICVSDELMEVDRDDAKVVSSVDMHRHDDYHHPVDAVFWPSL